jgi:hypothetical protein
MPTLYLGSLFAPGTTLNLSVSKFIVKCCARRKKTSTQFSCENRPAPHSLRTKSLKLVIKSTLRVSAFYRRVIRDDIILGYSQKLPGNGHTSPEVITDLPGTLSLESGHKVADKAPSHYKLATWPPRQPKEPPHPTPHPPFLPGKLLWPVLG